MNATDSEQKLDLDLTGASLQGASTLWQMTGKDLNAADRVGQPPEVTIREIPVDDPAKLITVAPISVNVYRFPLGH